MVNSIANIQGAFVTNVQDVPNPCKCHLSPSSVTPILQKAWVVPICFTEWERDIGIKG